MAKKKNKPKQVQTPQYINSYIVSGKNLKHRQQLGICIKCGATELFSNTKLCWECYKADRQAEND